MFGEGGERSELRMFILGFPLGYSHIVATTAGLLLILICCTGLEGRARGSGSGKESERLTSISTVVAIPNHFHSAFRFEKM